MLLKLDSNRWFFSPVTLEFDGLPWKAIGQLFYTTSSFVHHLKSIGEFKLELQSGSSQFALKLVIFCPMWPSNLMDDLVKVWKTIGHLLYAMSSFVHHFKAMGEFKLELQSGNAQLGSKPVIFCPVWPWNLSDDLEQGKSEGFDNCHRPSNLTQTGLKLLIFQPVWPWNLMDDLEK